MKKNIIAGMIAVVFIVTAGAAAPASALTIDELQTQIKELLAKVATLQAQLQTAVGSQIPAIDPTTITDAMKPGAHRICSILARNLSQGARGDDVRGLQEFLSSEGYLSANATGYFGQLTAQAVAKWQESQGVSAVGILGPMSRERIKGWCGGGGGWNNSERFNASPTRGDAPLSVTFSTWLSGFHANSVYYTIDFGDGTSERAASCSAPADACVSPGENKHTYAQNGTYTATLNRITDPCPDNGDPNAIRCMAAARTEVVAKAQIHVGPQACTKEYSPVCGSKPIVCITTPCNPIPQTYGNRCMMQADGATLAYEGACRDTSTNPADDLRCKAWFDGCNTCSRSSVGGPAACTMMACIQGMRSDESMPRPYCKAYFDDNQCSALPPAPCPAGHDIKWEHDAKGCRVSSQCVASGNKAPTISSFSGPTTLAVNASGTWTIQASDPENQSLKYSIVWGDEFQGIPAFMSTVMRDVYVQATTFTHSYAQAGTYTVIIVASDSSGAVAKTTSTVRVGASEPVACTADARQCPDGSWVGRTGPSCQFVCPN